MKGSGLKIFIIGVVLSMVLSFLLLENFTEYSDIVMFLSIIIGFEITSLSILFGSPLKRVLYDRKNILHKTELHRLRDYYRFSIVVCVVGVVLAILVPNFSINIGLCRPMGKFVIVLPIMFSAVYGFGFLFKELLDIFVYPTNEK